MIYLICFFSLSLFYKDKLPLLYRPDVSSLCLYNVATRDRLCYHSFI